MSIRSKAARGGTTAKILGSLGVVGAAAAIAGIGTFGDFTSSTTPISGDVGTGVLSIDLDLTDHASVPVVANGLLPGDARSIPLDLTNGGTVDWGAVTLKTWATRSSPLDTDTVRGLQLTVESCSQPWTAVGPDTYSCGGAVTGFYTGPIVTEGPLENAASLTPGGVDHLLATIALPRVAGGTMKDQVTDLRMVFTAVQRDGTAR